MGNKLVVASTKAMSFEKIEEHGYILEKEKSYGERT